MPIRGKARRVIVYSIRYDRQGLMTNAKPCAHCVKYLTQLGIKSTIYSNENGELVYSKLNELDSHLSSGNRF